MLIKYNSHCINLDQVTDFAIIENWKIIFYHPFHYEKETQYTLGHTEWSFKNKREAEVAFESIIDAFIVGRKAVNLSV